MKKAFIATLALAAGITAANAGTALTQEGYKLSLEYEVNVAPMATQNNHRSGVGIDDKFYVNEHATGVKVYDKDGNLLKTIPYSEGHFGWVSCNLDAAGHLLVQVDNHAFDGTCSAAGNHGFMVIDTKTDEVVKDFLPMTFSYANRFDAMAPVDKNILTDYNTRILSVLSGGVRSYQFSYNAVDKADPENGIPEYGFWKAAAFDTNAGLDVFCDGAKVQTSTGYALQYPGASAPEAAILVNPYFSNSGQRGTFSAEGMCGNGIRRYTGNWTAQEDWFYTPMHAGITGYNIFTLGEKQYIIYPTIAKQANGAYINAADAFAIAEVSFVQSPATDMTMEGETLVEGAPVGVVKALIEPARTEAGDVAYVAATSCTPSYNVVPVEGEDAVYIYVYSSGAPCAKYKFALGSDEPEPPVLGDPTEGATIAASAEMITEAGFTQEPYTIVVAKAEGVTNPAYHTNTEAVRAYAKNTITVSGGVIEKIRFVLASDAKFRYTTLTPDCGEITPAQAEGDTEVIWVGKADKVVFTVGEKATMGTDGATKPGQFRFASVDINGGKVEEPEPTVGTVGTVDTQQGFTLECLYTLDEVATLATVLAHRSGVGVNDKFYVNEHAVGIKVYNKYGELIKTIPAPEGYYNWVSCNVDQAGHLLVQLSKHAFNGVNNGAEHGFMVIDTETDEIIKDFLPMTFLGTYRFDSMSPVAGDVLTTDKIGIWSVLAGAPSSYRFLYNAVGAERLTYWTTKAFDSSWGIVSNETHPDLIFPAPADKQTSTGYAMQYTFAGDENFSVPVYANPEYTVTYSAEGKFGNGIRKFQPNYQPTNQWFYTPQHSGLTGYNFFNIDGKDFIIYPAGSSNTAADAFAIAEVSYVDSPATDMNMEGEKEVKGALKARVFAALDEEGTKALFGPASTACTPSFNIEPVEGDANSVYIYFFNSGAPASKWKFTYDPTQTGVNDVEAVDTDAPAVYYNLQGVRVANPTKGLYIKAQAGKATKVIL